MWRNSVITVIAAATAMTGLTLSACAGSTDWYAAGKTFAVSADKAQGNPSLIGVSPETWCSGNLLAAQPLVPAQRPSDTSGAAGRQWIAGCVAGYWSTH